MIPQPASAPSSPGADVARQARRWARLMAGLVAFGVGIALMKHSDLGLGPWEVLNDGLSRITGVSLGTVGIVVGVPILLLWLPLRERPGIGTILNIVVIGVVINEMLRLLPPLAVFQAFTPGAPVITQGVEMALGIGVIGFGSALYLGANLGAGPRDGLMMGLTRRTGWSLRITRTLIEIAALSAGWLLGGSVGVGTLAFALCIGPVVQAMFALTRTPDPRRGRAPDA